MPIYEFQAKGKAYCEHCVDGYELLLKIEDTHPLNCPQCAAPVQQKIAAPHVRSGDAHRMSQSHLEKHGFTQYRKAGGGVYEKTAGKGPDFISDDGK